MAKSFFVNQSPIFVKSFETMLYFWTTHNMEIQFWALIDNVTVHHWCFPPLWIFLGIIFCLTSLQNVRLRTIILSYKWCCHKWYTKTYLNLYYILSNQSSQSFTDRLTVINWPFGYLLSSYSYFTRCQ